MTDSTYALPAHRLSVGDTILVYWDGDRKWYPAEITEAKGDHECEVLYKDGEREWIDLEKARFNVWRNWDGSMRERRKRGKKSNVKVEGESFGIEKIREILFDTEDRIPLGGVHAGNIEWWKAWHDDVSMVVVKNDIRGLMDATLSLALQLKPSVTTTWWAKHSDCWKKRLKNAVTSREATLVVNDLRNNAISWSAARKLFSEEEGTASDRNCSHDGPMGLSPVNCRRPDRPLDLSGRRLDVKMRSSKPRKCSSSSGSAMFSSGVGKVQVVARRWSNCLKEKSTFEEKSSVKNSTGVLEHVGDPASSSEVVPSILRPTECEAGSMSAHSPPNNYFRENIDRVMFKNRGTSKGGDLRHSKIDEVFYACSSGDSTAACIYRRSGGIPCSICQSVEGRDFLVQCRNSSCFRGFHTYCLRPPLQTIEKDWLCPICDGSSLRGNLAKDKKQIAKRIHKIIGRKRVRIDEQKNVFQDQFLTKWESLSHHHDSWVPREWLQIFDPVRVHSYLKKCLPMDGSNVIDDRKPEWFKIDRIIACRRKCDSDKSCEIWNICSSSQENGEFEFLVKWMGLDYNDSTWESSCNEELLTEVGRLIQRHQRAAERVDNLNISSGSEPQNETPDELFGGTLYNYQLRGLKWILSNFKARRNVILADEMGLGKTVQVVSFIQCMKQEKLNVHPVLIVVPKSILFQWEKEFRHWAKDLNVIIYQGEKQSRRCIQTHEMYSSGKNVLFDVLVTNYELVILDKSILKKFKWSAIVIDVAHKIKRLDCCKLSSYLKQYISDFRLLLTGTPLQNTLLELFSLLHFIDPERFSDPEAEAESYKSMERLSVSDIERKIAEIHDHLKPRMLRRMKSDVLSGSIPVKKWVEVPCALTDSQRELYINILEKNYEKLNKQILSGRKTVLNFILMELRKCCNHLYLFTGQEPPLSSQEAIFSSLVSASGKLQLLEKLLPRLKERGNRVLLFSQMVKMLDILEDFLTFLGMPYFRIDGNTPIAARQQQMRDFNDLESKVFVFLISTRAGGLGIDLPTADRVIIYDPDFNPFMDMQAQSRAHRIGQTRSVVVYQLITKCSVEVKILQKSKEKLAIENLMMDPSKKLSVSELHSILLHGAHTILNRRNVKATSINYDDKAIDTLLKLDPAPGENCTPDNSGYLCSIQSFVTGDDENDRPASPKAEEWENILGPIEKNAKIGKLGRGKRRKKEVNYECDESDSVEIYTLEGSSSSSDSSDSSDSEAACYEMP